MDRRVTRNGWGVQSPLPRVLANFLRGTAFLAACLAIPSFETLPCRASVQFSVVSGSRAALADFDLVGSELRVILTNTSTADVLVPIDVLTGVFFDVPAPVALTRLSATLTAGSSVLFDSAPAGGIVGGEWAYKAGLAGAPQGAKSGISSAGLGLFGSGDNFPGANLQGPASPNGLQYGITSAGDNPATGNTPVTGANALIKNSVTFAFSFSQSFSLDEISNVSFQYGTALNEPNITTNSHAPEAASMVVWGLLIVCCQSGARRQRCL